MSEIKMSPEALIRALERMAVETGALNCLGCGHEHGCSIHGCAVLKAAAETIRAAVGDLKYTAFCEICDHCHRGQDEDPCGSCYRGERFVWRGASWRMGLGDWIPVEERMPDSPKNVLVSGGNYVDMASWQGAFMRFDPETGIGTECPGIRYWMPIPEPPEEE